MGTFMPRRLVFTTTPEGGDPTGGAGSTAPPAAAVAGTAGAAYTPPASQADLDRIIEGRLARERSRFADYDELKAKAKRADDLEAASASDLDKAVKKARDEATAEATVTVNKVLVDAVVRAQAAELHLRRPGDVVAILRAGGKLDAIKVTGGQPDEAAVKVALEDFVKERADLVEGAASAVIPGAGATDREDDKPTPGMGSLRLGYAKAATKKP